MALHLTAITPLNYAITPRCHYAFNIYDITPHRHYTNTCNYGTAPFRQNAEKLWPYASKLYIMALYQIENASMNYGVTSRR